MIAEIYVAKLFAAWSESESEACVPWKCKDTGLFQAFTRFRHVSFPQVRVAVIREEGSNGDREMAAAVHAAGMEVRNYAGWLWL